MKAREMKTFQCPKCGAICTNRLARAVGHPCPKDNKNVVEFKEIKNHGD